MFSWTIRFVANQGVLVSFKRKSRVSVLLVPEGFSEVGEVRLWCLPFLTRIPVALCVISVVISLPRIIFFCLSAVFHFFHSFFLCVCLCVCLLFFFSFFHIFLSYILSSVRSSFLCKLRCLCSRRLSPEECGVESRPVFDNEIPLLWDVKLQCAYHSYWWPSRGGRAKSRSRDRCARTSSAECCGTGDRWRLVSTCIVK